MRAIPMALVVLAVTLAGCNDAPSSTPVGGTPIDDVGEGLEMPSWNVGDWWTYQGPGNAFTLVVSEDAGASWFIDTTDADLAFFEAEFGPISYLGEQRKSDLAGSQGSDAVKFFDWPLEAGKTWTTQWDGEQMSMVAHDMGGESFHVIASVADVTRNEFLYSNATGWFEWMSFNDADGNEVFRMDLSDAGSNFAGELVRVEPELLATRNYQGVEAQSFELFGNTGVVEATDSDAYLFFGATCAQGAFTFAIGTVESAADSIAQAGISEGQGFSAMGQACPYTNGFGATIGESPGNGEHWGVLMQSDSPDLALGFNLYLRHFERFTL